MIFSKTFIIFAKSFYRDILSKRYVQIMLIPVILLMIISNIAEKNISKYSSKFHGFFTDSDCKGASFYNILIQFSCCTFIHYTSAWVYTIIFIGELNTIFSMSLYELTEKCLYLDYTYFHNQEIGKLLSILKRQACAYKNLLNIIIIDFLYSTIMFIMFLNDMRLFARKILFYAFLNLLIILIVLMFFICIILKKKKAVINIKKNLIANKMLDIFKNFTLIKSYSTEEKELRELKDGLNDADIYTKNFDLFKNTFSFIFRLILHIFYITCIYTLYIHKDSYNVNLQFYELIISYFLRFKKRISKIKDIFIKINDCYSDIISSEMIYYDVINEKFVSPRDFKTLDLINFSFVLPNKMMFLPFNINLKKGDKIAITGGNGQGKSTFIKSILGFYPYNGEILLDGATVCKNNDKSLRNLISYVSQTPHIVDGTVYDNLVYGMDNKLSIEELEKICIKLEEHDNFINLKNGYFTRTGVEGKFLSGGQCQMISFIRAIIRNAPIIILDEPTSNLDHFTNIKLLNIISNKLKNKIILYATHDIHCLSRFNKIINIGNGNVNLYENYQEVFNKHLKNEICL